MTMYAEKCSHCGHAIKEVAALDMLAELNIELPAYEIEIESAPEHWFNTPPGDNAALYRLRLLAEQLHVTTGFDRLICLDDIHVDHYQYQLEAALRALRDMRGQALLADEVGLGKTIEAGIVMKELVERGLVNSVLILTPASLTWQWHEEMESKFYETFMVLEKSKQLSVEPNNDPCRWIVSLDRAKSARWAERLLSREYDLLIVDEAHKLKNHRTQVYKFVSQIRKRYVLMLTATPLHNNLMELYNLISILRPGHLGTRSAFRDNFVMRVGGGLKHRVLTWQVKSVVGVSAYINSAAHVRNNRYTIYRAAITKIKGADFLFDNLPALPPPYDAKPYAVTKQDITAYQAVRGEFAELLQQGYQVTDVWVVTYKGWFWSSDKKQFKDKICGLRIELGRSQKEQETTLPEKNSALSRETSNRRESRRTVPRNPAALRQLLRELMIRNRRSSVGVRFPPRRAAVYVLTLTPPERELYNGVTAYIRQQVHHQIESGKSLGAMRMTLMTLQKLLCSSPQAVAENLEKLVAKEPNPQLTAYLALARTINPGCKVHAVFDILKHYPEKTLIFTDYLPTLHSLSASLSQAGIDTVVFHGGLTALERVEVVRQFRNQAQVMISTQSGSEGHNLQFCHQMINYDVPWNPMRIEQRVGRLHRLGQQETVLIFNLSAVDTIEAYILDLLAHKIRMFELVIGELDMILGELSDQHSFEQYIEKAWVSSQSEAELQHMMAELEAVLDSAQNTYNEIRAASDGLSDLLEAMDEVYGP
ncbi:MAG: DEAD/DEAH box helicase family protein [Anaerolineae bacterium]|nr:DEAD/DEAH box helicase family protein [Anaerolineae bacterium]